MKSFIAAFVLILGTLSLVTWTPPAAALPEPATPPGCVAWWPANGTALDSVGHNDGTLVNGAGYGPGKWGLAFSFDGINDALDLGSASLLGSGSDPFTLSMWINLNRLFDSSHYTLLAGLHHDAGQFWLSVEDHHGHGPRILTTFRQHSGTWGHTVDSVAMVGKWVNLVAVYTGGNKDSISSYRVYLNGDELPIESSDYWFIGGFVNNNWFGYDPFDGAGTVDGRVDDVRIFDRALTHEEILSIGLAVPATKPMGRIALLVGLLLMGSVVLVVRLRGRPEEPSA